MWDDTERIKRVLAGKTCHEANFSTKNPDNDQVGNEPAPTR